MAGEKLKREFYLDEDVVGISRRLLGKLLVTNLNGGIRGGMITETEAYRGVTDRASHAYGDRRTNRTEVMYGMGGKAYVYLCYGIHHLFNVVTSEADVPHAVLVRGIFPVIGKALIEKSTGKNSNMYRNFNGPGKLSDALGIRSAHSGEDLLGEHIWIEESGLTVSGEQIISGPRIGVDYAGDDALLEYRFRIREEIIPQLAAMIGR